MYAGTGEAGAEAGCSMRITSGTPMPEQATNWDSAGPSTRPVRVRRHDELVVTGLNLVQQNDLGRLWATALRLDAHSNGLKLPQRLIRLHDDACNTLVTHLKRSHTYRRIVAN